MPPKIKQEPTTPPPVTPQPTGPALGAAPADPGNVNNQTSVGGLPQSGTIIDADPNNSGLPTATITVNGKLITLTLNSNIKGNMPVGATIHGGSYENFQTALNSIGTDGKGGPGWYDNTSTRQKYIDEMYAAGLLTSKKSPSAAEVALAWQLVVQEAALQVADGDSGDSTMYSPDEVLAKAAQTGWNNINAKQALGDVGVNGTGNRNNSAETSSQSTTVYKSFVDPATAMGTLADSYFRLMGRNPTQGEYNAFLHNVYNYQEQENTGKFETKDTGPNTGAIDPATGQPVDQSGTTGGTSTNTNVVSQRGIGTRGLQFMAGQQALASPEEGAYQAATTYFNAFIKALQGPASGMEASGPTVTIP